MKFVIISRAAVQKRIIGAQRIFNISLRLKENGHDVYIVAPEFDYPQIERYDYSFCDGFIAVKANRTPLSKLLSKFKRRSSLSKETHDISISHGQKLPVISLTKVKFLFNKFFFFDQYYRQYFKISEKDFSNALFHNYQIRSLFASPDTIVITSSKPEYLVHTGVKIKKRFPKVFWIADFRDSPVNNPYIHNEYNRLNSNYAALALEYADLVTVTSEGIKRDLQSFNTDKKIKDVIDIEVIHNGFSGKIDQKKVCEKNDNLAILKIAYLGTLYSERKISVLMKCLCNRELNRYYKLVYAGASFEKVNILSEKMRCRASVENFGYVSKEESLRIQNRSDLLLLLKSPNVEHGILTGKFFEYLATGKPILVLGDKDEIFNEIARKIGGVYILPYDEEKIKKFLIDFANRWPFEIERNTEEVNKFNWDSLTKRLIEEVKKRLKRS